MARKVQLDISTLPPTPRAAAAQQRVDELLKPVDVVILNGAQEIALSALLDGKAQKEAAKLATVAPETVCRWLANDSGFVAELNRRRSELWHAQQNRIRNLADKALDELALLIEDTNPKIQLQAIAMVLQASANTPASGPMTPGAVEKAWFVERSSDEGISPLDIMLANLASGR